LDKFARETAGRLGGEVGAKQGRETAGNIFGIPERIGRATGTRKGQEMYDKAKETLGGFLKQEDYESDAFDIILEYLVAEGYADTNKAAIAIMANMSEEWKQSIVEAREEEGKSKEEKRRIRTERSGRTGPHADYERRGDHQERDERSKDLADIRKGKKKNSSHFSYLP